MKADEMLDWIFGSFVPSFEQPVEWFPTLSHTLLLHLSEMQAPHSDPYREYLMLYVYCAQGDFRK